MVVFTGNKTGITSFSLNFTADVEFNNSVTVTCQDQANDNNSLLTGPPTTSPSLLSDNAINFTSVNISWSPFSEQCLDYYYVTVTNQSTKQQDNLTNASTFVTTISNKLERVQYIYTVAVADGANRVDHRLMVQFPIMSWGYKQQLTYLMICHKLTRQLT